MRKDVPPWWMSDLGLVYNDKAKSVSHSHPRTDVGWWLWGDLHLIHHLHIPKPLGAKYLASNGKHNAVMTGSASPCRQNHIIDFIWKVKQSRGKRVFFIFNQGVAEVFLQFVKLNEMRTCICAPLMQRLVVVGVEAGRQDAFLLFCHISQSYFKRTTF